MTLALFCAFSLCVIFTTWLRARETEPHPVCLIGSIVSTTLTVGLIVVITLGWMWERIWVFVD